MEKEPPLGLIITYSTWPASSSWGGSLVSASCSISSNWFKVEKVCRDTLRRRDSPQHLKGMTWRDAKTAQGF